MGQQLQFGGPNLQSGQHTWYYDLTQPTQVIVAGDRRGLATDYAMVRADVGDVVDAEKVKDPEYYIGRGMAVWVPGTPPTEEPPTPKES